MTKVIPMLLATLAMQPLLARMFARPPPKEPKPLCSHFSVEGDFLYWKANVSHLPYAVLAEVETAFEGFQFPNKESVREVQFHYDPGFRIAATGRFDTGWGLLAEYTCFHTSGSAVKRVDFPDIIFSLWDLALPAMVDKISAHQFLNFGEFHLDIVKRFSPSKDFSLDPFFGATGAMMHQGLSITEHQVFDPPAVGTVKTRIKNNFSGGGLRIGFQTSYTPIKWVALYGKGAYSILYGKFKLSSRSRDTVDIPPTVSIVHRESTNELSLVSAFDVIAGVKANWPLSWGELILNLGYEFVFWPSQVRVPRIRSDITSKTPITLLDNAKGDVGFHGLVAGLAVCF